MDEITAKENTIFKEVPTKKIYTQRAILLGTYLAGPLAGAYLISENFKVFNDTDKARKTWILAILYLQLFGAIVLLTSPSVPSLPFIVINGILFSFFSTKYQGQNIAEHIVNGGETFGWWRLIIISLIGIVLSVGNLYIISLFI